MKLLQSLAGKLNRLNDVQEIGATIADRAPPADRLPQLPRGPPRRRPAEADRVRGRLRRASRQRRRGLHDGRRRGDHRPGRRVAASHCSSRTRWSASTRSRPEHGRDRRVAGRGAAALRLAGHRGDRDLEARPRPVRRGRHPAARGACRPGVGRARERAALRPAAAGGAMPRRCSPFRDEVSRAQSFDEICTRTVDTAATLFETPVVSLWLQDNAGDFYRAASCGSAERLDCRRERRPSRRSNGASRSAARPLSWLRSSRATASPAGSPWRRTTRRRPPRRSCALLAAFSYQASVALRKARLYWQQLEAAEIANALLDASRELATADSPEGRPQPPPSR